MAANIYLNWACNKAHKKEHVSFSNFVKKFDITDKESANEAYLSLINSDHIRENRRKRLGDAYRVFRERNEDIFWERRALKIADRRLLINSAIVAKKTAIMNQKAGVKETSSGFRRYQSDLEAIYDSDEVIDDDESESEAEAETNSAGSIAVVESMKQKRSNTNTCDVGKRLQGYTKGNDKDGAPMESKSAPNNAAISSRKRKMSKSSVISEGCWHDLYISLSKLYNNEKDVTFPSVPDGLSLNHSSLFKLARDCLITYRNQMTNKDIILLKDAQVAMSCTANLLSNDISKYFEKEFIAKASNVSKDDTFDHDDEIVNLLAKLKGSIDNGGPSMVRDDATIMKAEMVRKRREQRQSTRSRAEKILEAVETACDLASEKPFGKAPSECDCLNAWVNIFKFLLPDGLTCHTGETSLDSSKPVQSELASEYGNELSESGRRVDLRFSYKGIEVANIELRSPTEKRTSRAKQTRKSIRLNRCIQRSLEKKGLESPTIMSADVAGYMALFYSVAKVEDIYVAGMISDHSKYLAKLGEVALDAAEEQQANFAINEFVNDVKYTAPAEGCVSKSFEATVILSPKRKRVSPGNPSSLNFRISKSTQSNLVWDSEVEAEAETENEFASFQNMIVMSPKPRKTSHEY
ncbi:hypothetical protein BGZ80_000825 [Entomortierella chlamydospora]|uniref:Uncharacterized protein n=1 Tax=Entomortierella chlamydospora TaxID=101097 RepID=A0A9P6MSQ1_9FUNG|nr:hypothetical protein BGZ80_000825 [Entomortierella chlamydospora]